MEPRRGKALIVDDEPSIQRLLTQKLASEGYYCAVAADGEQALEESGKHGFAVVLLDIRLPGLSGVEVLRRLAELQPEACVVMVSGQSDLPVAVECMKLGASDYISKPFDLADLTLRVDRALQRHKLLREQHNREGTLEERVHQQGGEIRALVGQTVQSLVREHLVQRRLSQQIRGRKKIKAEELRQLSQTIRSFLNSSGTGEGVSSYPPQKPQTAKNSSLTEKIKRLRRALAGE